MLSMGLINKWYALKPSSCDDYKYVSPNSMERQTLLDVLIRPEWKLKLRCEQRCKAAATLDITNSKGMSMCAHSACMHVCMSVCMLARMQTRNRRLRPMEDIIYIYTYT